MTICHRQHIRIISALILAAFLSGEACLSEPFVSHRDTLAPQTSLIDTIPQDTREKNGTHPKWDVSQFFSSEANRVLVFTESVEAIDEELIQSAQRSGQRYLRLTLRDPQDLERLWVRIALKDGRIIQEEGPLAKIIREGGTLLIDYTLSNPKIVEGLNSLFDREPHFNGIMASPQLKVIGAMKPNQFGDYPGSFYSRYQDAAEVSPPSYRDRVDDIETAGEDVEGVSVELDGSPWYVEELIGGYYLDEEGAIQVRLGALPRAIMEGRPLLIYGADWQDEGFRHYLRQVLLHGGVWFNGEFYSLPAGTKILKKEGGLSEGLEDKRIIVGESSMDAPLWVINEVTQDSLFSLTQIVDGKLTQTKGLLSQPRLKLRISGKVEEWVWNKLMHAKGTEVEIEVGDASEVPAQYKDKIWAGARPLIVPPTHNSFESAGEEKVLVVAGQDQGLLQAQVIEKFGQENVVTYFVTSETAASDITSSINVEGREGERLRFASNLKGAIRALREGKMLLVSGALENPFFLKEIEPLLCQEPYLVVNGERIDLRTLAGRVLISARQGELVGAAPRVELDQDDKALFRALKREFPNLRREDFTKLIEIRKIYKTIPPPTKPGLYPPGVRLGYNRLRMILRYEDLQRGLEEVVISPYEDAPEVAAFMRLWARVLFGGRDEPQKTINGTKLKVVLGKVVPLLQMGDFYWQLADALSVDLVRETGVAQDYQAAHSQSVLRAIEEALIGNSEGERREYYSKRFGLSTEVGECPAINWNGMRGTAGETWQEKKARLRAILDRFPALFFRGPPGTTALDPQKISRFPSLTSLLYPMGPFW